MKEILKRIVGSESDYVSNFGNIYQRKNGKFVQKKRNVYRRLAMSM
jgi:hypothetical protein